MQNNSNKRSRSAPLLVSLVFVMMNCHSFAGPLGAGNEVAGEVKAIANGREISLPLLKSNYDVDIDGTLATITLEQTFFNASDQPLNATYLFPMNQKAAVYAMTMEVGNETIEAVIQRKGEALQTFETAKNEGKAASLLVQHRPNMFTQNIANLMPQMPIKITLKYVQQLPKVDNAYELVVPMIVGPRYEGKVPIHLADELGFVDVHDEPHNEPVTQREIAPEPTTKISGWNVEKLPAYPPVIGHNAPSIIDQRRVSFSMKLKSPTPISAMFSNTHNLEITSDEFQATATFAAEHEIDNRDLVIRYEISKETDVAAGVTSHFDDRGGFMSFLIEPPKIAADEVVTPRELVFVLDTSGSMSGQPIDASKVFMNTALQNMRANDYFRVLRFSNNTSQFATEAVEATQVNIRKAQRFVDGISAGGGTEMNSAINTAFDLPPVSGAMRIVVFLTDGYIGADRQVIQTVSNRIGDARIYAFGVGNAPNRFLLEGLAKEGRGRARFIELGENGTEVAKALAANLDTPVLTDISIDWNGLEVSDETPSRIPDLFAGTSINVMARYKTGGKHQITLNGLVNGRKAAMPITVDLAGKSNLSETNNQSAIPLIWAREQIFDKNRAYTIDGGKNKKLQEEITQLGLEYSLQSPFTSFVAVSKVAYNDNVQDAKTKAVPLPKVSGVSTNAYPTLNLSGNSTPEPEAFLGIFGALTLLLLRFKKALTLSLFGKKNKNAVNIPFCLKKDGWWLE